MTTCKQCRQLPGEYSYVVCFCDKHAPMIEEYPKLVKAYWLLDEVVGSNIDKIKQLSDELAASKAEIERLNRPTTQSCPVCDARANDEGGG